MSLTRHAPDPLHVRETLCGAAVERVGHHVDTVASIGDVIDCEQCRRVCNALAKCIAPHRFILVRAP